MKYLTLFTTVVFAANEALPNLSLLDPVARTGAVGVLGFLLLWVHMKTLPNMAKEWRESSDKLAEALAQLRVHCATREDK